MEKEIFQKEYLIKSSTSILYNYLTTPSGLSEWFCDNVNIKDEVYYFMWDGSEDEAKLKGKKKGEFIRWQWLDDEDTSCYFELKIRIEGLTKEAALVVTDFAESDEMEEAIMLWDKQIDKLKRILGS